MICYVILQLTKVNFHNIKDINSENKVLKYPSKPAFIIYKNAKVLFAKRIDPNTNVSLHSLFAIFFNILESEAVFRRNQNNFKHINSFEIIDPIKAAARKTLQQRKITPKKLKLGENKMNSTIKKSLAAAVIALSATAANAASIVDIAANDSRFTTLVAAVKAAGLAETLSGKGHFTVFAPVNAAFDALPAGTVETLLKPENKGQLTDILLYHVDDRVLTSGMLSHGSIYIKPILASKRLCVTKNMKGVTIGDSTGTVANVVIADIKADNGVIHVIDKVLLPGNRPACH